MAAHAGWAPGYHIGNVLLHLAAGALVALTARTMGGLSRPWAFAVGLLFLISDHMAQSVAFISGRAGILSGIGMLGALAAAGKASQTGRARWAAISLLAGIFALASKEDTLVLPLIILGGAALLGRRGRAPHRHLLAVVVGHWVLLVTYLSARWAMFGSPASHPHYTAAINSPLQQPVIWAHWFAIFVRNPLLALGLASALVSLTAGKGARESVGIIALSGLERQCLHRRLPDLETLQAEATAWEVARNGRATSVD